MKHIEPKLAVGYVRCSTEMQEDSPDQQKKEILVFAEQRGYNVIDWFVDFGKSGTTFNFRPEFQRLVKIVDHKPTFTAVICYDESRWGRAIDAEENTSWRVYFRQRGVQVVLVKTSVDWNNDFAPMLAAFEGVQASQYSKKLSELTLRGAKSNGIYSNGGTAPYGYTRIALNTKTGTERELKPGEWCVSGQEKVKWGLGSPEEIRVVHLIYERRRLGVGYGTIAMELNRDNIPCPKRGRWRNADQKWSEVTVRTIIENQSYYGARIYNRNSMSKILARQTGRDLKYNVSYPHWQNDPGEWVIAEGAHDPIVSKELWMKANAFHAVMNRSANHVRHNSQYLLSGLIRCSWCGFTFQGWSAKVRKRTYAKYVDSGAVNKHVCPHLGIKTELLDDFAINAVYETVSDPLMQNSIEKHLKRLIESQPQTAELELDRIKRAIQDIQAKIDNITEAIETGCGSATLLERLRALEEEQKALKIKLGGIKTTQKFVFDLIDAGEIIRRFMLNFEQQFKLAPIEERKRLVKKVISEIVVDRDRNVVRFYVRRIPSVIPVIDELIKKEKELTNVVSSQCSGGRNFSQLTTLIREFEYAL